MGIGTITVEVHLPTDPTDEQIIEAVRRALRRIGQGL